jgi:hypothetical protein
MGRCAILPQAGCSALSPTENRPTGTLMIEFVRLFYLAVIILPLAVLFIGPLLTLAALRGRQRIGPITLEPGRRGMAGRIGALLLGLVAWLVVWGGLAAILAWAVPTMGGRISASILQVNVTPTQPPAVTTLTATPAPPATPQPLASPIPTLPQTEEVPTPSLSVTPSPIPSTSTPVHAYLFAHARCYSVTGTSERSHRRRRSGQ